jgi:hypothetical protein
VAIHYTTFVMPQQMTGFEWATPVLVLAADSTEEIPKIPLVTSMHVLDNTAMPLAHATPVLGEFPVSDVWVTVSQREYDERAKVVIVRDPVPVGDTTESAVLGAGVSGERLPGWLDLMFTAQIRSATRDVPCGYGSDAASVVMSTEHVHGLKDWAHQLIPPES